MSLSRSPKHRNWYDSLTSPEYPRMRARDGEAACFDAHSQSGLVRECRSLRRERWCSFQCPFCDCYCYKVLPLHFRWSSSCSLLYTFIPCSPAFPFIFFFSIHLLLRLCRWLSPALRCLISLNWLFHVTVSRFAGFPVINYFPLSLSRCVMHFVSLLHFHLSGIFNPRLKR